MLLMTVPAAVAAALSPAQALKVTASEVIGRQSVKVRCSHCCALACFVSKVFKELLLQHHTQGVGCASSCLYDGVEEPPCRGDCVASCVTVCLARALALPTATCVTWALPAHQVGVLAAPMTLLVPSSARSLLLTHMLDMGLPLRFECLASHAQRAAHAPVLKFATWCNAMGAAAAVWHNHDCASLAPQGRCQTMLACGQLVQASR
jgi:hypothetical protein